MNTKDLQQITKKIITEFQPEKIILFGSQAWGTPTADSDVDLCILSNTTNTRKLAQQIDSSIFPRPFPIDILVYTPAHAEARRKQGDQFITKILTQGKFLYAA